MISLSGKNIRLAIVGTRELSGFPIVEKAVAQGLATLGSVVKIAPYGTMTYNPKDDHGPAIVVEVVSGGARGVDRLAELYAEKIGVPCKVFEPRNGPAGGRPIVSVKAMMDARNQEIVNYADAMVAIRLPDQSPGTDDAIERMRAAKKPFVVYDLRPVFVEFFDGNSKHTAG